MGWETVQEGGVIDVNLLSLLLVRNPGRVNGVVFPVRSDLRGADRYQPGDTRSSGCIPGGHRPELITKLLTGNAGDISLDELGNLKAVIESADGQADCRHPQGRCRWQYDLMSDAPATRT